MKKHLITIIFMLLALSSHAQDVTIDLTTLSPTSGDQVTTSISGISLNFVQGAGTNPGAIMYQGWGSYEFTISCTDKPMQVIELYGHGNLSNTSRGTEVEIISGGGKLTHNPGKISVWEGNTSKLVLNSPAGSTYYVTQIKIWHDASTYTPSTDGDGGGGGGNVSLIDTQLLGKPMVRTVVTPVDGTPVKMAIISARKFQTQVENYALWKTQQGYQVEEIYAEDYNQDGTLTGDAWAQAIRQHLIDTRPAFVLIMGDDIHVPAFDGTFEYHAKSSNDTDYVTDYYYGEYEGNDFWPEAYVGRFSAYDAEELENQMLKTQHMAFLSTADGAWLGNSLCLVAPDGSDDTIVMGDQYAREYLGKLGSSVTASSPSSPGTINATINSGCSLVTYFGHGNTGNLDGKYTLNHAAELSNAGRYPVMLALTCLTGTFDNGPWKTVVCLAEKMQRMKDAGTVCYVGATRESYADKQFLSGGTKDGQTYLGFMRSIFPINEENTLNQQSRTIGEAVAIARYSISCYIDRYMQWATEYHELFGDPTYQPYHTTPLTMTLSAPAKAVAGHTISVTAAPEAVVCISQGRQIVAVAVADHNGRAYLSIDKEATGGSYTLYASAPNYTDCSTSITLSPYEGNGNLEPSAFDFDEFKRHRVLVEKFTGQYCQYCASDDATLNTYIEEQQLDSKMYELRYYTYTNDRLSMPVEPFDIMRSPWGITGHPTYMVDRHGFGDATFSNCGFTTRANIIKNLDWVNDRYYRPCRVSLSLDGTTYDPTTRILKVVVSGKALPELVDLRVNLFIAQNGIIAYQSGGSSNYEHNGVSRAYLTENALGDKFDVREDGIFQVEKYYTLPEQIGYYETNRDKMDIVAFISSWDDYAYPEGPTGKDFENCEVHNTITASLGSLPTDALAPTLPTLLPTGEEKITDKKEEIRNTFDLAGRRVSSSARGILIQNGRKVIR